MQIVYLRIVGVGVQHIVCDTLYGVEVRHLFQHVKMLVPCEVERCEGFGIHTRLAVETRCRGRGLYRLEVKVAYIAQAEGVPEFAHGNIGIFEIFQYVCRKYVTCGSLVHDGKPFLASKLGHSLVEASGIQRVDGRAPVAQEARGCLGAVDDISEQGG